MLRRVLRVWGLWRSNPDVLPFAAPDSPSFSLSFIARPLSSPDEHAWADGQPIGRIAPMSPGWKLVFDEAGGLVVDAQRVRSRRASVVAGKAGHPLEMRVLSERPGLLASVAAPP